MKLPRVFWFVFGAGAFVVGGSCSRAAATSDAAGRAEPAIATVQPPREPGRTDGCAAGSLPRIDERALAAPFDAAAVLAAAERGGVAVVWDGKKAALVAGCHLRGGYTIVPEKGGPRVLRTTTRPLFMPDEFPDECQSATHLVAALLTGGKGGALKAILLPLPCPSVHDKQPARGCVGRGLSGKERLAKGRALATEYAGRDRGHRDLAREVEIHSLIPDDYAGAQVVAQASDGDVATHGSWIASQYEPEDDYGDPEGFHLKPKGKRSLDPNPNLVVPRIGGQPVHLPSNPVFRFCFAAFSPDFFPELIF